MKSNIYTKNGDSGLTGLVGGTRVKKNDLRLEAYGTIDELNCFIGMIRSYPLDPFDLETIIFIQNKLFSIGGYLATDQEKISPKGKTLIKEESIIRLEEAIDLIDSTLPLLNFFILPGGDPQSATAHIARTVCRRAERIIISLAEVIKIDNNISLFINRLSDYLFVLARKLQKKSKTEEIAWITS